MIGDDDATAVFKRFWDTMVGDSLPSSDYSQFTSRFAGRLDLVELAFVHA